jgi:DNA-binding GntR family transcriptional regulator
VNKQERTYTVLRDRIHSGAVAPRARLNIDGIARELGVSAIPVREALRRLEAEGWVRFQPNVGAIVAPVDATAWEQQLAAVAILEGAATADAVARLTQADLAKVRKLAAEMEQVAAEGDLARFSRLNRRLHAMITARCANVYLLELLEQTSQRLDRLREEMFSYLPERSAAAVKEHAHLIDLLEAGDPAEVERYARWHKLQTVEAYRATHELLARAARVVSGDAPPADRCRPDPHPHPVGARAPWLQPEGVQPGCLVRGLHDLRQSAHHDRPAGPGGRIEGVGLEPHVVPDFHRRQL